MHFFTHANHGTPLWDDPPKLELLAGPAAQALLPHCVVVVPRCNKKDSRSKRRVSVMISSTHTHHNNRKVRSSQAERRHSNRNVLIKSRSDEPQNGWKSDEHHSPTGHACYTGLVAHRGDQTSRKETPARSPHENKSGGSNAKEIRLTFGRLVGAVVFHTNRRAVSSVPSAPVTLSGVVAGAPELLVVIEVNSAGVADTEEQSRIPPVADVDCAPTVLARARVRTSFSRPQRRRPRSSLHPHPHPHHRHRQGLHHLPLLGFGWWASAF